MFLQFSFIDVSDVSVEQLIEIKILDENDNGPVFRPSRYTIQMPEELPIGAGVMPVFATDADIGENARLIYSILSSEAAKYFYMDSLYSAQAGLIRILKVRFENKISGIS
jgi:hypothetical protein